MEGIYNTSNYVRAPSKQPYEGHSEIIYIPRPEQSVWYFAGMVHLWFWPIRVMKNNRLKKN